MKVGDKINTRNARWSFRGSVFKNFDSHISKSVPLYKECQELYVNFSDFFTMNKSKVIDIGCSTGSFLSAVFSRHNHNKEKKIIFEGYDTVKEMISFAKKRCKKQKIKFKIQDALKVNYENTCIVSSFYTVQFIPPKKRQILINRIYKGLNWGGAFFMVEKVRGPDARFQDYLNQFYIDYKITKNYSANEIISKGKSLKGVLEPFSSKGNLDMLKRAGFKDVTTIFKYACFEGFLAIK